MTGIPANDVAAPGLAAPPNTDAPDRDLLEGRLPEGPVPDGTAPDGLLADGGVAIGSVPDDVLRLAEAMIFASASPITPRLLSRVLPEGVDAALVIEAVRTRYAGRGVEIADVAGGVQFRTAPDLAPALRKVIEVPRRLTRVAMETLAIVAYHQPVTRPEIEHLRGASLAQQTLDQLLEATLIAPAGRKDAPGRPTLWATTPEFLAAFGLRTLKDLPRREDLFVEPPRPTGEPAANDRDPPLTATDPTATDPPAADPPATDPDLTSTVPPAPASC